ncbi:sporulation protein [Halomonas sp. 18H]|uniref:sporulation protein n=1 Tax=Halomonas almeriensis TaxID=308163 RepID=UPI002230AB0D|nr:MULTISPECIES: sporulation protein [Halomonas]MCW4153378.1 sporulation protein [Halomonas sp. 18H]MDN3553805.1 sporulation protein [Halomonas almeriensis]
MFDKLMAAVGIGNARIDTMLDTDTAEAGSVLKGEIHIVGGEVSQELDALVLDLASEAIQEVDDEKVKVPHAWATLRIAEPMTIQPGEERTLPFEMTLPLLSPLSVGREHPKTWVATRADIAMAIDPRDKDPLRILPGELQRNVFEAMDQLGFTMTSAPLELSRKNPATGCLQEFEFKPTTGSRFRHLDEAEIAFLPSNQTGEGLDLLVQRDTRATGLGSLLSEMAGTDEQFTRISLAGNETTETLRKQLESVLT